MGGRLQAVSDCHFSSYEPRAAVARRSALLQSRVPWMVGDGRTVESEVLCDVNVEP